MKLEVSGDRRTRAFQPTPDEMDDPNHPALEEFRARFRSRLVETIPDPAAVIESAPKQIRRASGRCEGTNIVARALRLDAADVVPLLLALPAEKAADFALLMAEILDGPYMLRYGRAIRLGSFDGLKLLDNATRRVVTLAANEGLVSIEWERAFDSFFAQGLRRRSEQLSPR